MLPKIHRVRWSCFHQKTKHFGIILAMLEHLRWGLAISRAPKLLVVQSCITETKHNESLPLVIPLWSSIHQPTDWKPNTVGQTANDNIFMRGFGCTCVAALGKWRHRPWKRITVSDLTGMELWFRAWSRMSARPTLVPHFVELTIIYNNWTQNAQQESHVWKES